MAVQIGYTTGFVHLPIRVSAPCRLLTRKQKGVGKPKLDVSRSVPVFSVEGQGKGWSSAALSGRLHNMSALSQHFLVLIAYSLVVYYVWIKQQEAVLYMEPERQVISRSADECVVALCDQWSVSVHRSSLLSTTVKLFCSQTSDKERMWRCASASVNKKNYREEKNLMVVI